MNIREAKEQVKRAVSVYLMKDGNGNYRIPLEHQRPVFLYGAPGIGKTAIMEQIAKEMGISLVSYSMTYHTRQSALGLPYIVQREYKGKTYDVSRYTMSEIIASVYEKMEESGCDEGILFLDEINCVSETLGPSMLQFLQYKVFGNLRVPDGWVIVTAGNPPEFNRSVREFDVVTMDRLKVMTIEPDYDAWKKYAVRNEVHRSITTYLDIKKEDFYDIENTIEGRSYVTARGWEDLSDAIKLYEEKGYPVDESLISQYLRNNRIIGEFGVYYKLYVKYKNDYQIMEILKGKEKPEVDERGKQASFDERLSVTGLLLEAVMPFIKNNLLLEDSLKKEHAELKEEKARISQTASKEVKIHFEEKKDAFKAEVARLNDRIAKTKTGLSNIFSFVARNFGEESEMLILVTELTVGYYSSRFIAEHGCDEYFEYNKKFLIYERGAELDSEIGELEKGGLFEHSFDIE